MTTNDNDMIALQLTKSKQMKKALAYAFRQLTVGSPQNQFG